MKKRSNVFDKMDSKKHNFIHEFIMIIPLSEKFKNILAVTW